MFFVYAGMPRSGSAYLYHLLNEASEAAGFANGRQIKAKFHLEDIMLDEENRVEIPAGRVLVRLWAASVRARPFVVKTHAGPTPWLLRLIRLGAVRVIQSYRDPRDVLVSALDEGRRERERRERIFFWQFRTVDDAMPSLREWVENWDRYTRIPGILSVKYESLVTDTFGSVETLMKDLGWNVGPDILRRILDRYSPQNVTQPDARVLHFNQGIIGRYRTALTTEQIVRLERELGDRIVRMGYGSS